MAGADKSTTQESFDRQASQKRASLVRDQWNDYKTRFQPTEEQIINIAGTGMNTNLNQAGINAASQGVNTAFDNAIGMQNRDMNRYGINPTDASSTQMMSENNLNRTAANANAVNTANQWDVDRRNAIMTGGIGNASITARG